MGKQVILSLSDFRKNRYSDEEYQMIKIVKDALSGAIERTDYDLNMQKMEDGEIAYSLQVSLGGFDYIAYDSKMTNEEIKNVLTKALFAGDLISLEGVKLKDEFGNSLLGLRYVDPRFTNMDSALAIDFTIDDRLDNIKEAQGTTSNAKNNSPETVVEGGTQAESNEVEEDTSEETTSDPSDDKGSTESSDK